MPMLMQTRIGIMTTTTQGRCIQCPYRVRPNPNHPATNIWPKFPRDLVLYPRLYVHTNLPLLNTQTDWDWKMVGNPVFTTILSVTMPNINGYPIILLTILPIGRMINLFSMSLTTENIFETVLVQSLIEWGGYTEGNAPDYRPE